MYGGGGAPSSIVMSSAGVVSEVYNATSYYDNITGAGLQNNFYGFGSLNDRSPSKSLDLDAVGNGKADQASVSYVIKHSFAAP